MDCGSCCKSFVVSRIVDVTYTSRPKKEGGVMSYNVCLKCRQMVAHYDKYCVTCRTKYPLPNLPDFQKDWYPANFDEEAKREVEKDLMEVNK